MKSFPCKKQTIVQQGNNKDNTHQKQQSSVCFLTVLPSFKIVQSAILKKIIIQTKSTKHFTAETVKIDLSDPGTQLPWEIRRLMSKQKQVDTVVQTLLTAHLRT